MRLWLVNKVITSLFILHCTIELWSISSFYQIFGLFLNLPLCIIVLQVSVFSALKVTSLLPVLLLPLFGIMGTGEVSKVFTNRWWPFLHFSILSHDTYWSTCKEFSTGKTGILQRGEHDVLGSDGDCRFSWGRRTAPQDCSWVRHLNPQRIIRDRKSEHIKNTKNQFFKWPILRFSCDCNFKWFRSLLLFNSIYRSFCAEFSCWLGRENAVCLWGNVANLLLPNGRFCSVIGKRGRFIWKRISYHILHIS